MKRINQLAAMALASAFILTACGGDDLTGPTAQRGLTSPDEPEAPAQIEILVRTSGVDLDRDGYVLGLDGGFHPVDVQSQLTIGGLESGMHTLWLADIAENCELSGPITDRVSLEPGGTARVQYEVACH